MKIEVVNAKSEVKEFIDGCTMCGMCKPLCPVFKSLRTENNSPRGKVMMLDNDFFEEFVYDCSLCKACEDSCPVELKLCNAFKKTREILVLQGKEHPENKKMISNLQGTGNIFGIKE